MWDPTLSDSDFKNKMALVRTKVGCFFPMVVISIQRMRNSDEMTIEKTNPTLPLILEDSDVVNPEGSFKMSPTRVTKIILKYKILALFLEIINF